MVSTSPSEVTASERPGANRFYFAAWRWHFYAGLYVIPFLLMLAITGLLMMWSLVLDGGDGERFAVRPTGDPIAVESQAELAVAAVPGALLAGYIAPAAADRAALFRVAAGEDTTLVAVDPFTGAVLARFPADTSWFNLFNDIHGTLLIGTAGDRLIEIAASLGIVMIATGLYLWWPRGSGLGAALVPNLRARGRGLWKSLHSTVGIWCSVLLLFFLISGLSWAGIWGDRFVQAWSSFPAVKFENVPLSDETHASMNHDGMKEVPWALEQTPMPASGSHAGAAGLPEGMPVTFPNLVALAQSLGFENRFQLAAPMGDEGVWTISRDSMSHDSKDASSDRTVHVDQYTGRILADVNFADYSVVGKAMAVGIALHQGDLGWWNVALNTVYCLGVIFLAVSGAVMWWKRRPAGVLRLAAPPAPRDMGIWKGAASVGVVLAIAFPMAGLAIVAALLLDFLVLSRVPAARRLMS